MAKINSALRDVILVLGMHRSGTSAVTGVLSKLGAALPANLMGGGASNELGHFESVAMKEFHDELLLSAGSSWNDWRRFNTFWYKSPEAKAFKEVAKNRFVADFRDRPLTILKDPRICRFVPFWTEVINELDGRSRAVIPVRFPLEVAMSLRKRDRTSHSGALLLWLRHVLDAEAETRKIPRSIFRWDDFLTDWQLSVEKISQDIGVTWSRFSDRSRSEIDSFLSPALTHHYVDNARVVRHPEIHEWTMEAYHSLLELAKDASSKAAHSTLDQIRVDFNKACDFFGRAFIDFEDEVEREKSTAKAAQVEKDRFVAELVIAREENQALLQDRDAQIAVLGNQMQVEVSRRDRSIDQLNVMIGELEKERQNWVSQCDRARDDLAAAHLDRDQMIAEKEEALASAQNRLATQVSENARAAAVSDQRIKELESEAEKLQTQIDVIRSEGEASTAALEHKLSALTDEMKEVADASDLRIEQTEQMLAENAGIQREYNSLQARMTEAQLSLEKMETALGAARKEQEKIAADMGGKLAAKSKEAAEAIASREQRIAELEGQMQGLQMTLSQAINSAQKFQDRLVLLQDQHEQAKTVAESFHQASLAQAVSNAQRLQAQVTQLQQELALAQSCKDAPFVSPSRNS